MAGQFYPSAAAELRGAVGAYLATARVTSGLIGAERQIVGVVAPHAGYDYSGLTAACAFASLEGRRYDAVLLLGSPHQVPVRGASVFTGRGMVTPLGVVRVEQELARSIASSGALFGTEMAPHLPEHSLEVELPFLQTVLGDVAVVPVLIMGDRAQLDSIAGALADALDSFRRKGKSVLLVISTDLAHYPSRGDAEAVDREMLDALCAVDGARLEEASDRLLARGIAGLVCAMCGLDAAYVGLQVARRLGATEGKLLHASTSADAGVPGADASRVVGYGAVALLDAPPPGRFEPLGEEERAFLLGFARRTLEAAASRVRLPVPDLPTAYLAHLEEPRGVFVTLTIGGELRGCIGTHEPEGPLWQTVRQMALAAAFEDPRFGPLSRLELSRVRIEISVYLTRLEPIRSAEEYVVGRQGIILRVGDRAATFLPKVPEGQGWDRVTTLRELCLKAGLPEEAWRSPEARFLVYETQAFSEAERAR